MIKYNGQNLQKRYHQNKEVIKVMYHGKQIWPEIVSTGAYFNVDSIQFDATGGTNTNVQVISDTSWSITE